MRIQFKAVLLAAAVTVPFAAGAYTEEDYLAWFKENQSAQPQFAEGDTITFDKADQVRPFIPKEFQSEWIFEGMEMKIKDAGDISNSDVYKAATPKAGCLSRPLHAASGIHNPDAIPARGPGAECFIENTD